VADAIRVLQIVGNSVIGGAENHVLTLVRALDPARYRVQVVCPRPGPLVDALRQARIRVHLIDMVQPAAGDEYELRLPAMWELFALLRRWRPHVVHSHLYPAQLHGALAAELAEVPAVVTTAHTLVTRPGDAWLAALTRTRIIAVSQAAKSVLVNAGVPPGRIRVIYNGIEPHFFADESATGLRLRRELSIPDDALVIGIIARLSPEKGHDRFLRMARDVARQYPDTRFLIVGSGPLEAELRDHAAALGLHDRVIFTGARRDITALNHVLDIFVLPSREEALPLAVLEAMAACRPVVASAVGGVPEVVTDGQTGFLFAPDEHARFVEALLKLADDPQLGAELGRLGQQRVRRQFGVDRMVRETLGYYDALLASSPTAGRL